MLHLISKFIRSSVQTKFFFMALATTMVVTLGGVAFAFGRLDFQRSTFPKAEEKKIQFKTVNQ